MARLEAERLEAETPRQRLSRENAEWSVHQATEAMELSSDDEPSDDEPVNAFSKKEKIVDYTELSLEEGLSITRQLLDCVNDSNPTRPLEHFGELLKYGSFSKNVIVQSGIGFAVGSFYKKVKMSDSDRALVKTKIKEVKKHIKEHFNMPLGEPSNELRTEKPAAEDFVKSAADCISDLKKAKRKVIVVEEEEEEAACVEEIVDSKFKQGQQVEALWRGGDKYYPGQTARW